MKHQLLKIRRNLNRDLLFYCNPALQHSLFSAVFTPYLIYNQLKQQIYALSTTIVANNDSPSSAGFISNFIKTFPLVKGYTDLHMCDKLTCEYNVESHHQNTPLLSLG
jgi:hypothetical protein